MPEPSSSPSPHGTGDDRCLAGLCAALEASRGEPPERVLAGFAEALAVEFAAYLQLRDGLAVLRVLGARERRPTADAELRLPATWMAALTEGRVLAGSAATLAPGERATLRVTASSALLLAPVPALEGPPGAALLLGHLSEGTWSSCQEQALRGLAAGLAGWTTARAWQQVLDALPQRIAWKDGGLRYRGANRGFTRAAGLAGSQLLGRVDADLPLRSESGDHGPLALRREQAALTSPQLRHLEAVPLTGGRELWFEVSRLPLDGGGLLIVRDEVTARVQLGQQLQLAQRTAAIGRLAAGVGIGLRPLAAEIADAIVGVPETPARARALDCARAADDLARRLAAFARRQICEPVELAPGQLLARLGPTLARLLGERGRLHLAPATLRCAVRLDPRLGEQLFVALVTHLGERLGERGRIDVEVAPDSLDEARALALALPTGDYVRVRLLAGPVGVGVDERAHDLHLALARTIAAHAGGGVHGEPHRGGLQLDVLLPRVFTAPRAFDDPGPPVDLRGAERLLLIEDDPLLAQTLACVLRHLGYEVLVTDDPAAALRRLATCPEGQATRISLALISAALPGPAELPRRLREAQPDLRVLWLAGAATGQVTGGDPRVVPCSFEALALRVRQALDARSS